jgi:hypothetical protein
MEAVALFQFLARSLCSLCEVIRAMEERLRQLPFHIRCNTSLQAWIRRPSEAWHGAFPRISAYKMWPAGAKPPPSTVRCTLPSAKKAAYACPL